MRTPHQPFDVLGQVGPILAWVEGDHGSRLPSTWTTESVPFELRERDWLLRELPTYSFDNVEEIVKGSRATHRRDRRSAAAGHPRRSMTAPALAPPPNYELLEAFRRLFHHFITWNGTEACIQEGRMEELHELGVRLPVGHIVRHGHARLVSEGVISFEQAAALPELMSLLPSNSVGLRTVVRRGLSESHLHLNAVISAEESWADTLLRPLSAPVLRSRSPAEGRLLLLNLFAGRLLALAVWTSLVEGAARRNVDGRGLLELLDEIYFARSRHEEEVAGARLQAAISQALLGAASSGSGGGNGLVGSWIPPRYEFLLRWMAPAVYAVRRLGHGRSLPRGAQEGLRERQGLVHALHLAAHLRMIQLSPRRDAAPEPGPPVSAAERTPGPPPPGELEFLHQALFRYLVCRTHHWQMATQHGRTTGLRHFREFFGSRQREVVGFSDMHYSELVLERLREWRGLRVLEGRVGPPKRPADLAPWVLAYSRPTDRRIDKFGLVIHFKKEHEWCEERGLQRASPVPQIRWGRRRRRLREEGGRLFRLLRSTTPITPFVVGIDACNLELSTPPEVFAPVFRFLREFPIALAESCPRFSPYFALQSSIHRIVRRRRLGMTYHVGEDFRHLLSGLRAIYEVTEFLAPGPGDRLGHGTALALHPEDWLKSNGYQAIVPRLEWLDTLVWVLHFLGPGDEVCAELGLADRIQRLSWQIYSESGGYQYDPLRVGGPSDRDGSRPAGHRPTDRQRGLYDWDWSPLTLWDAWHLRQLDPYSIELRELLVGRLESRSPAGASQGARRWHQIQGRILEGERLRVGSRNAYLLLALYWMSPQVRREGDRLEIVDMSEERGPWLELCRRVEAKMRRRIHRRELVVEVNPSSNRIIGPMERYDQHHVFHLTLGEDRRLDREVRVSVNTDNPAVCNTTLAHEYYLLGEVLMASGVPEAEVVRWLDWLRRNGDEYNFARRLKSADDDPDMASLLEWLRAIRPSVREVRGAVAKLDALWGWMQRCRLRESGFDFEERPVPRETARRIASLEGRVGPRSVAAALERLVELEARLSSLESPTGGVVRRDPWQDDPAGDDGLSGSGGAPMDGRRP